MTTKKTEKSPVDRIEDALCRLNDLAQTAQHSELLRQIHTDLETAIEDERSGVDMLVEEARAEAAAETAEDLKAEHEHDLKEVAPYGSLVVTPSNGGFYVMRTGEQGANYAPRPRSRWLRNFEQLVTELRDWL